MPNPGIGTYVYYIAPVMHLCAMILIWKAYLAPHPQSGPSQLTITRNTYPGLNPASLRIGMFGSCPLGGDCSVVSGGSYDLSILPNTTASFVLQPPDMSFGAFAGLSVAFTFLSLILWIAFLFIGPIAPIFWQYLFAYLPVVAFGLGIVVWLSLFLSFGKCRHDFNAAYEYRDLPVDYVANLGNGFYYVWVAYGMLIHSTTILWAYHFMPVEDKKKKGGKGAQAA